MARADFVTGIVVFVLGLGWALLALQLPLQQAGAPGPGFLPLSVALFTAILGAGLAARSWRADGPGPIWPDRLALRRVLVIYAALAGYAALMDFLGFLGSTLLLLAGLIRFWGGYRWRVVVMLSTLLAVASFAVFRLWLGVALPSGTLF